MRKYVLYLLAGGSIAVCFSLALMMFSFFKQVTFITIVVCLGGTSVSFIFAGYGLTKLARHGYLMTDIKWLLKN